MRDDGVLVLGRVVEVVRSSGILEYFEGGVVFEGFVVEWDVGWGG